MAHKNAPARQGESAGEPGSFAIAYNTERTQQQFLSSRFGLSFARASIIAPLIFGEVRHA
ncbi:hypothetical protein [Sphingobium phenoxybenzoativorans]|uniref:hypothetical protein n=1 Tax=Sphingobium phenoxybenzoativorans TaxID=1592790 RepID=UPI0008730644|nr:hypothetical protein [Sphingobium phenoxybenzoativorans]